MNNAAAGQVKSVDIKGTDGIAIDTQGTHHNVTLPDCSGGSGCAFADTLQADKTSTGESVDVKFEQANSANYLLSVLVPNIILVVLIAAFMWWVLRQTQSGNNQAISFGRSRARMVAGDKPTITFADVAGVDEAKQELAEIVEFLKYPEKFVALGARIPKGVLLVGPPGTGKTLLSKAVAGEAGVPFFSISGSEFVEMFVGVGASRVRDLFDQAKKNSPCIVFVDEIDAVGRQRGAGLGGGHDEREQTLTILAARANKKVIGMTELKEGIERVVAGPEKKSRRLSEHEKEIVAYHEVGHALVAKALPKCDPVHKVSIISRGQALGVTWYLPTEDRYLTSKAELLDNVAAAMGGRVAEEIVFGDVTSGAENDIQKVTNIARRMVTQWGMSDKLGTVTMGHKEELVFLGRDLGEQRNYSEEVAAVIDEEIRSIVNHGYQTAKTILTAQRTKMDAVVDRLKVVETLSSVELDEILAGEYQPGAAAASSGASAS
ncbi:MAG: AAA family ATPase [Chloroflexi bacterium]|nr:MAG: AAA family ATPase [Chloroflexota bacterium]